MLTTFYDIESLNNVFTVVSYNAHTNRINVYFIDDDNLLHSDDAAAWQKHKDMLDQAIVRANPILKSGRMKTPSVCYFPLSTPVGIYMFMNEFLMESADSFENKRFYNWGDQVRERGKGSKWLKMLDDNCRLARPVHDTDPAFDNETKHPYLLGYNSYNYDTTMLAYVFSHLMTNAGVPDSTGRADYMVIDRGLTAHVIRRVNDALFTDQFRSQMPSFLRYVEDENVRRYIEADEIFPLDPEVRRSDARYAHIKEQWRTKENQMRQGMLKTGRHLDVARLNEKQAKVGLKRLLGMLGYQILESDKLSTDQSTLATADEFAELIAYNVSDVIYLKELFETPVYASTFDRNMQMLESYPELTHESQDGKLGSSDRIRANRLYIDSSSQQFASRSLCPEGNLDDKATVNLTYPDATRGAEAGIEPYDVLEFAKDFFISEVVPKITDEAQAKIATDQFMTVYNQYAAIRGTNFNESDRHSLNPQNAKHAPKRLTDTAPALPYCMPYYDGDGNPTSCFAVFSTGGVHGAEANLARYLNDVALWRAEKDNLDFIQSIFGDTPEGAVALRNAVEKAAAPITSDADGNPISFPDGKEHFCKDFLAGGFTKTRAQWRTTEEPQLFQSTPTGSNKLNPRYTWTSAARTNHEDFSSYYPSLLRMMNVFFNQMLGYDRYGEMYDNKERLGALMKDHTYDEEQRRRFSLDRNGVKLTLNTASGAGDAKFDNPVRMNNNIIAMRVIGQLFTWYIGQKQALEGAKIVSTNTDGLYTVLEETKNNQLLAEAAEHIHIKIDPEPMYLISKDSNNRLEFDVVPATADDAPVVAVTTDKDGDVYATQATDADGNFIKFRVLSASGGMLACRRGPDVLKSLAHPAVIDWALAEYLMRIFVRSNFEQSALAEPFDRALGKEILAEALEDSDRVHTLLMFQNVLASNPSSNTYNFALDMSETELDAYLAEEVAEGLPHTELDAVVGVNFLQHYNRTFIMRDGTPNTKHLFAASQRKPTPAIINKRKRASGDGSWSTVAESPLAQKVLQHNGVNTAQLRETHDIVRKKITGIEPDWFIYIENHDLRLLDDDQINWILSNLDVARYVDMLEKTYEDTWRNHLD